MGLQASLTVIVKAMARGGMVKVRRGDKIDVFVTYRYIYGLEKHRRVRSTYQGYIGLVYGRSEGYIKRMEGGECNMVFETSRVCCTQGCTNNCHIRIPCSNDDITSPTFHTSEITLRPPVNQSNTPLVRTPYAPMFFQAVDIMVCDKYINFVPPPHLHHSSSSHRFHNNRK